MPRALKRSDQYSRSGLDKLKRQCTRNETDDEASLQRDDSIDDVDEMSVGSERGCEAETAHSESPSISTPQMSVDDGMEHASNSSECDSSEDSFNVRVAEGTSDCESECCFGNDDDHDEDNVNFGEGECVEDDLLYEGAPITVAESMISILSFAVRHGVPGTLLSDLLKLIALHCPPDNKCASTLYKFKKYFSGMTAPLIRHFHCKNCYGRVEKEDSICPSCEVESKNDYFIEVPIIPQIQALFKRPGFYEMLQHKLTRERENINNIEDVYDGAVYKDLSQDGGFLDGDSGKNNVSWTWYTDGIRIFKSSKYSIWPVYLVINELPFSVRTKKENVVLAALWFGDEKPVPNLFLAPLLPSIRELRQGISVNIPNAEAPLVVKGMITCGTCDLPAKALFLNMKQYNGKFGCQKCKQEGTYLPEEKVLVYPYEEIVLRTDDETREHARLAFDTGEVQCGVKGPTVVASLVHQYMRATAVDVMHCVDEGIIKALMNFFFSPTFSNHPASMIASIDIVEDRMAALTPPSSVQRMPRSIRQHLAYWKASERKFWFHYLSIPCLQDLMDEEYFEHYILLVLGVTMLSKSSISEDELNIASRALRKFVSRFERLYHLPNMSNNLHQLLHLVENVRQFGPLWTTSCFPFEDLNGTLKKFVHGSNSAQLQIQSAASMVLHLVTLNSEKLTEGTLAHSFCENLSYKQGRLKRHWVSDTTYIVGKYQKVLEVPPAIQEMLAQSVNRGTTYLKYPRVLKGKILFSSTEYTRSTKTDSTFALYSAEDGSNHIGRIRCFIRVSDCLCNGICNCNAQNYAVLRRCILENKFSTCIEDRCVDRCIDVHGTPLSTVHNIVDFEDNELAVEIKKLKCVCCYSEIEDPPGRFVIEPVNLVEFE